MKTSRLIYTPGEPAGVGPDLIIQIIQQGFAAEIVVISDPDLLKQRAAQLNLPLQLREYNPALAAQPLRAGELAYIPIKLAAEVEAGKLNTANATYVLNSLDIAIEGCLNNQFDAYITGPAHKGIINEAGIAFSGHTEYLADKTATDKVVMMLATEGLRVALVTTHLPLSEVPKAITESNLTQAIQILHRDLENHFGIVEPAILVCGLNPHAGEGGHMGREEIDIIEPTLAKLRSAYDYNLIGPLPADTLFTPKVLADADAVLSMYHDQGLPVLKYKGFGNAVNITLGLPIIRTSVDHGTALDLAGTGKANSGSLLTALQYAEAMISSRQKSV